MSGKVLQRQTGWALNGALVEVSMAFSGGGKG